MEKYICCKEDDPTLIEAINICFSKGCGNCNYSGFPCYNAAFYSNLNSQLVHKWNINI